MSRKQAVRCNNFAMLRPYITNFINFVTIFFRPTSCTIQHEVITRAGIELGNTKEGKFIEWLKNVLRRKREILYSTDNVFVVNLFVYVRISVVFLSHIVGT